MEDYFVKFYSVSKEYGGLYYLNNINIGLNKGRCVGVFGPAFSGKTSFCNLLCGIDTPSEGKVLIDNKKIRAKTKNRISCLLKADLIKNFKYIKQLTEFYETYFRDFNMADFMGFMKIFGIDPNKPIKSFNEGERQLTALSCLAARRTEIYVLDEPLTYFDRGERENYLKTALKFPDGSPLVVIAAQNLRGIDSFLDDVVFLDGGEIKLVRTKAEIWEKTNKSVEEFYKEVFSGGESFSLQEQ